MGIYRIFHLTYALRMLVIYSLIFGIYAIIPAMFFANGKDGLHILLRDTETAFGIVLGLLLIFRTNRVYDRWWEARTLWGDLVNTSRNLAIKIHQLVKLDPEDKRTISELIAEYPQALRQHLQVDLHSKKNPKYVEKMKPVNYPIAIVNTLYQYLQTWLAENRLTPQNFWIIDQEARRLMDICGACERIKFTLMPKSYRIFTKHIMFAFLIILPWTFAPSLVYWAMPVTAASAYILLGLEGIASTIEEPFGLTEDDVQMDQISQVIQRSVSQIFGVGKEG